MVVVVREGEVLTGQPQPVVVVAKLPAITRKVEARSTPRVCCVVMLIFAPSPGPATTSPERTERMAAPAQAQAQTYRLPHLPPEQPVHVALYEDVTNSSDLKRALLAGDGDYEYAFIDAGAVRTWPIISRPSTIEDR